MTNDTNTLNGALRELGETMAANLTTQGVPSTYDEGLTTLAGKILDISPTPASWDGMSLSKTAGKQILSYADSGATPETEYCTVTAQLLEGASSATISGVPVVFGAYQNDVLISGSEQSVNTDSNGQASYTYTTQGLGDVVVKAVPDSRTSLIQSFVVHDYLWVPKLDGTETIHQVQGTTTISNNEMYGGSGYIGAFDNSNNWEISFKCKWSNSQCGIWIIKSDETSRDKNDILIIPSDIYSHVNGTGTRTQLGRTMVYSSWFNCKLTKNSTSMTFEIIGESISKTFTWSLATSLSTLSIGVDAWGGTSYIKEIVVKPL